MDAITWLFTVFEQHLFLTNTLICLLVHLVSSERDYERQLPDSNLSDPIVTEMLVCFRVCSSTYRALNGLQAVVVSESNESRQPVMYACKCGMMCECCHGTAFQVDVNIYVV